MRLLAIGGGITVLVIILLFIWWPKESPKADKSTSSAGAMESANKATKSDTSPSKAKEFPSLRRGEAPSLVAPAVVVDTAPSVNVGHTAPATDSLVDAFQNEARSAELAPGREQTIRVIVEKLQEDLESTTTLSSSECKSRHCRLELGGEITQMLPILDALQDERGLMGQAESMMFTRENGGIQVYLRFPEPGSTDTKLLPLQN